MSERCNYFILQIIFIGSDAKVKKLSTMPSLTQKRVTDFRYSPRFLTPNPKLLNIIHLILR